MENLYWIIILLVLSLAGFFIGYFIRKLIAKQRVDSAEVKAENLINEAKQKQKEFLLEARDKAIKIIDDAKREEASRRQELKYLQNRLEKREELFDKKLLDLENKSQRLQDKAVEIGKLKEKIIGIKEEQITKLEKIAELSQEEAKGVILEETEKRIKDELLARIRKLEKEGGNRKKI